MRILRATLKALFIGIVGILALVVVLIAYLSITEYRPKKVETIDFPKVAKEQVDLEGEYRLLTFNIGYGGLDESADFFMDGGSGVLAEDKSLVQNNLKGIGQIINAIDADFNLLQEVDINSKRSFYINQKEFLDHEVLRDSSLYAPNYRVKYVPYPWPTLGKVESGLMTHGKMEVGHGERRALSSPFKWPVSIANLKRGLLVTYHPIKNFDGELVLINLHLEAYDDTGGSIKQAEELLSFMESQYEKGNYVIAGGDWNQSFFPLEELPYPLKEHLWQPGTIPADQVKDGWKFFTDEEKRPSCRLLNAPYHPDHATYYVIDGFLVSPNVEVVSTKVVDEAFSYSDHNPVVMEFRFK